jgi:hypothetical protein
MNVFWVLAYDKYYPSGGLGNVKRTFPSREEAAEYAETIQGYDYVEIQDVSRMLGVPE